MAFRKHSVFPPKRHILKNQARNIMYIKDSISFKVLCQVVVQTQKFMSNNVIYIQRCRIFDTFATDTAMVFIFTGTTIPTLTQKQSSEWYARNGKKCRSAMTLVPATYFNIFSPQIAIARNSFVKVISFSGLMLLYHDYNVMN